MKTLSHSRKDFIEMKTSRRKKVQVEKEGRVDIRNEKSQKRVAISASGRNRVKELEKDPVPAILRGGKKREGRLSLKEKGAT